MRANLLKHLPDPVILETHGGRGLVWQKVYSHLKRGMVCEMDSSKVDVLVRQRPTWCVYQCDATRALAEGLGSHLPVNLIDLDGECWPTLAAFLDSERELPQRLGIAVNDGLRQKLRLQGGWHVKSMHEACRHFGNLAMHARYLDICRWNVERLAGAHGYRLALWAGYHCGAGDDMTHFAAVLDRQTH